MGSTRKGPPSVRILFSYRDGEGSVQSGSIIADERTRLFKLRPGDVFPIRISPQEPSRYYVREASSLITQFRVWFWIAMMISFILFWLTKAFGK